MGAEKKSKHSALNRQRLSVRFFCSRSDSFEGYLRHLGTPEGAIQAQASGWSVREVRPPVKTRLVGGKINLNEQARGARDDDQLERRIDAGRTGWYRSSRGRKFKAMAEFSRAF